MKEDLRKKLKIDAKKLDDLNALLLDPGNPVINGLLEIVEKFGGPEEINRKAAEARKLDNLLARLKEEGSPYLADLEWLTEQRDNKSFVSFKDWQKKITGENAPVDMDRGVTLEISALQFFPWLIAEAKRSIENGELMPGRYIRVRNMKEQVQDQGDILAIAAAMQIIGASYVETLDTKGTDGSNVHLGGPATIAGYFGGVGQPNDYPFKWVEEFLHYYTTYGIKQVLNINPGTILAGYILHKLGIDNEFKISVFMGNDNPLAVMWTLAGAKLFSRDDDMTSLIGFNFSNSVNNDTIRDSSWVRGRLGFEEVVRFEHHITETFKSIVVQPYNRRDELVEIAKEVPNISAKHEGNDPEIDGAQEHPSDILDYFAPKEDIEKQGLMEAMMNNYLGKHDACNRSAEVLIKAGIAVIYAQNLH
ncbi:MAG: hypothetical protein E3J72_10780 [Planctomycetota bacterium]|nr:MAG: hypothetical protein E3J72_10780 [Planctomycetota bacterium]